MILEKCIFVLCSLFLLWVAPLLLLIVFMGAFVVATLLWLIKKGY